MKQVNSICIFEKICNKAEIFVSTETWILIREGADEVSVAIIFENGCGGKFYGQTLQII